MSGENRTVLAVSSHSTTGSHSGTRPRFHTEGRHVLSLPLVFVFLGA